MAIDAYLQIDGIQGESADAQHPGWIECGSVNWKLHQPRSATASTAGGHTAERAELPDVTFTKLCDLSSPILAQSCATGKTIPKANSNSSVPMVTVRASSTTKSNWKTSSSATWPRRWRRASA